MRNVHKAMAVMMMATAFCAAVAEAAPAQADRAPLEASIPGPTRLTSIRSQSGPSDEPVAAIPTPSGMSLGAAGLAILAGTRIARRVRLAA